MPSNQSDPLPEGRRATQLVRVGTAPSALRDPYLLDARLAGPEDGGPDARERLRRLVTALRKHKWLILALTFATLAVGFIATSMVTPLYTSTVRLQIDRTVAKVVEGGSTQPFENSDSDFLRTQYELLQSRAMAERVAAALRLGEDADFLSPRSFSILGVVQSLFGGGAPRTDGQAAIGAKDRAAARIIMGSRTVRPLPGSRLVDITFSDPSPKRAQAIAAAYGEAFIAANLDKRFQANAYAKSFLEDQIKQLKLRLEESERVLLQFAEREQIVVVNEKSSNAENNLAAANAALGVIISERIKSEQLWNQVSAANAIAINLPQLLTNSVIDGLRGRRNALVTEYQEKLETFKPSYPAMVQIRNKIAEIDRQLAAEVQTLKESFKAAYESALSQEAELKKRIEALKDEVLDLQKRSIQYNILKREVDTNRQLYDSLLQRFKEVDVAGGVGANNVFVIDRAEIPTSPSSPQLTRALLLSLLIGLGLGCAAAYVFEHFDDSLHSVQHLEQISGLPTLGVIPAPAGGTTMDDAIADPQSAVSEAYRSLCTALQIGSQSALPSSLLVTSANLAVGKSFTAIAISRHFARTGLKVLLVDADLRNPSLHKKLGYDNSIGLSNYLTGAVKPPEAIQATEIPDLAFMTSGPLPPNAADLLAGTRLPTLLKVGLEIFDLIVLDGPPVLGLADAPVMASVAAGTIVVASAGETRIGALAGALRRLRHARAALLGSVMTKYEAHHDGYGYGYGYGYGGAYTYGTTNAGVDQARPPRARIAGG